MHWWQNAFSSPSSSTLSPTGSQPEDRSAFKTDLASLLSRSRGFSFHSKERRRRRLTRARKLRHLTDDDVGAGFSSARSSCAVSPHPLPLPELAVLLRRDARRDAASNSSSKYVPLPAPQQPFKKTRDEREKSDSTNGATTGAFGSILASPDNLRNKEPTLSQKSPQEQKGSERVNINYKVNIHCSCPTSPAVSPERTGDDFTSYYLSPPAIQVWSAPEFPPSDPTLGHGLPYPISPGRYTFSVDSSPLHSPKVSPRPSIRSPRGSTSPLHSSPKLSPRQSASTRSPGRHNSPLHKILSTDRRDSNAQATVHPLPLPPGAVVPLLLNPPAKVKAKAEVTPMKSLWKKGKLIGRGTFGSVYVASNRETGALCAMKEVELLPDDPKCAECIKQLEQEIKVLSQLKHPNIVQYYGSEIVGERFYIYLEYVHPGSINKYIRDHCGAITESIVRNFTRHILSGLAYLHSKKTIHRDIKGANLLVDANGVVKLADFGMAKHLSGQAGYLSLKGSPYWMAPELLHCAITKDASPDLALAVDIWSLGCTIIEMLNGKPPWSEYEGAAAMFRVMQENPPIPETLSPEGKDFLRCCFLRNPAERPSANMLLEHRFLKNSLQLDVPSFTHLLNGMTLKDKPHPQRTSSNYKFDQLPFSMESPSMQGKLVNNEDDQRSLPETSNLMVCSPCSILKGIPCSSPSCSSQCTGHPLPSSVAILGSYSEVQGAAWRDQMKIPCNSPRWFHYWEASKHCDTDGLNH